MSGGVDSSVAAWLMKQNGYACAGATMILHKDHGNDPSCGSNDDARDAEAVASALGMEFYTFDCSDLFDSAVIQRFVRAYEEGRTPNPCIDCNRYLKFDEFLFSIITKVANVVANAKWGFVNLYNMKSVFVILFYVSMFQLNS